MSQFYLLSSFANLNHLVENRLEKEHSSSIRFTDGTVHIELSETNSLVEDKYSLNLSSAKYVVEGNVTERKEAMIHHHPKGHQWKHLQFKLKSKNEVIRIKLDGLDDDDYQNCIKGFLHISQKIISHEQKENHVTEDLLKFFFNDHIKTLAREEQFLLQKIKFSFENRGVLDNANNVLDRNQIERLKSEEHLMPFFTWD